MAEHHGSASAEPAAPLSVADLDTDQLDRLVRQLDRHLRDAVRTLVDDPALDEARTLAACARIELRRRRARDRLSKARDLLVRVGDRWGASRAS